jgi:hypothetical protein
MKVNKKVSDLARKLNYIGVDSKYRRKIIKNYLDPIKTFLFGKNPLISIIELGYEMLKEESEKYDLLEKENKNLQERYNDIRNNIYPLTN